MEAHELALKRYQKGKEALTETHLNVIQDKEFKRGDQWPAGIKKEREDTNRPCLTMNAIPQFTAQITNSNAMNRPRIRVIPVGEGADEETAKVLNGIIRHIQNNSSAKTAYNTAFGNCVDTGIGGFSLDVDYITDRSNKQDIFINRIRNNLTIIPDPAAQKLDRSDMEWCFVDKDYDPDEFEEEFGKKNVLNLDTMSDLQTDWYGERVKVSEYFYKQYEADEVYTMPDGTDILASEYDAIQEKSEELLPEPIKTRKTKRMTIMWCLMDGEEFIEGPTPLLFNNIPVVVMVGEEEDIQGKVYLNGKIKDLKDPQMEFNFWRTAETETMALFPKPKWIGPKGSFKSNRADWDNANNINRATLEYDLVIGPEGQPLPAPQFQQFNGTVMGAERLSLQSVENMKFISGQYSPSLGSLDEERSGVAVKALQSRGDVGSYVYTDHEIVSLEYAGKLLVDVIPKVFDTPDEIVRVLDEDGTTRKETINKSNVRRDQQGVQMENPYQLNQGTYDVVIEVGADYQTKRQENREYLMDFAAKFPAFSELVPDLVAKEMDFTAAHDMVERFQMLLEQKYPGMIKMGDQKVSPAQFMALVQKSQQMQQAIQQLQAELQDKNQDRQLEKYKVDMSYQEEVLKAQGKAQSDQTKQQGDIIEQQLKSQSDLVKSREKNITELEKAKITRTVDIT